MRYSRLWVGLVIACPLWVSGVLAQGAKKPVLIPCMGHADKVASVAFSPDGKTLASGSFDGTIIRWDTVTGEQKQSLRGHTGSVNSVAFSPDGKTLASGSSDNTVILWDGALGQHDGGTKARKRTLTGHTDSVTAVEIVGRVLASASRDLSVRLWQLDTFALIKEFQAHSSWILSLHVLSPNEFVSASSDQTIKVWSVSPGQIEPLITIKDTNFKSDSAWHWGMHVVAKLS